MGNLTWKPLLNSYATDCMLFVAIIIIIIVMINVTRPRRRQLFADNARSATRHLHRDGRPAISRPRDLRIIITITFTDKHKYINIIYVLRLLYMDCMSILFWSTYYKSIIQYNNYIYVSIYGMYTKIMTIMCTYTVLVRCGLPINYTCTQI